MTGRLRKMSPSLNTTSTNLPFPSKIPYIYRHTLLLIPCGKEPMRNNDTAFHHPPKCRCKEQGAAIRGFLIPCLLFLLKDEPCHGYQLIERLQSAGYLKEIPHPGVIYRHLRRLEQERMVTSEFEPGDGPARKVYTLTEEGLAHMKSWISDLHQLENRLDSFLSDVGR